MREEEMSRAESELRDSEAQTEQVESELEELEQAIERLEAAIADLESEGDAEIAADLQSALERRMQEKRELQNQAEQIASQLEGVRQSVLAIDAWNEEAASIVGQLASTEPEAYQAAVNRISDRQRWVEEQDGKIAELQQRLQRITSGSS